MPPQLPRWSTVPVLVAIVLASWSTGHHFEPVVVAQSRETPTFEVDPDWPKPLPNGWSVGPVSGISVDARDHIWIVHRGAVVRRAGGIPAPPVIEFDPAGNVVQAWGGPRQEPEPQYDWPAQVHGITIDHKERVWISGNGATDAHILAFSRDGTFLRQIGRAGPHGSNSDTVGLARATQMRVDPATDEVFVSDGEMNLHHRVIVFDAETGQYKRHWGAYGRQPADTDPADTPVFDPSGPPPSQFGSAVHCLRLSEDGLVYVCDRSNNRFQVFRRNGTFVAELFLARETPGLGSVWDIDLSPDQRFMYVADGTNQKVWILRRDTLQVLDSFGGKGAEPGRFATYLHDIVVDSSGNLFTGEADTAGRVQKFVLK